MNTLDKIISFFKWNIITYSCTWIMKKVGTWNTYVATMATLHHFDYKAETDETHEQYMAYWKAALEKYEASKKSKEQK